MILARRFHLALLLFPVIPLFPALRGDTVFLKNGNWIDGIVRARNEKIVEIEIGRIGKVEIPLEDVHEIEKNKRTGDETQLSNEIKKRDVRIVTKDGKRVLLGGGKDKDKGDGESEDGEEPDKEKEGEAGDVLVDVDDDAEEAADEAAEEEAEKDADGVSSPKIDPELRAKIEQLILDLERQKPQYRVRAERHLKAIGQPALPFLLKATKHDQDLSRIAVFRLFNDFGDDTVIEASIEALLDSNEYVRDAANKTLERITRENFGYQPAASPKRRELAHAKWKRWWEKEVAELKKVEDLKKR
ncbi:MAG TPA: hypothetical protein VMT52_10560 [Planctomycetota bacterium]|nr:hypothetical protein [Planctomycetota bacterium]